MSGKKLLVADDSLTIQKVIRLALSNEGYEITAVSDGGDAVNQILLSRPDLVLIDVSLPGKNAFEVKREINTHEDYRETCFVLISSAFEKIDESQIEEVKFHGRLTKPFDPAHLRKVLADVLAELTAKREEPTTFIHPSHLMNPGGKTQRNQPQPSSPTRAEPPALGTPPFPSMQQRSTPATPLPPAFSPEETQDFPELGSLPDFTNDHFRGPEAIPPFPKDLPLPQEELPALPLESADSLGFTDAPPSFSSGDFDDQDIKKLTESTLRISGLDDYQWNMSEPSLKPPTALMDRGGSSFQLNSSRTTSRETMPPPPPPMGNDLHFDHSLPEISLSDRAAASFDLPPVTPPPLPQEDGFGAHASEFDSETEAEFRSAATLLPSEEKIDAIIHNQIEAMLEKRIQKLLPEITEKLVKQEIQKLLSE
ncbi:MAG: response regulator [Bdellovibrionia bacterium]